MFDQIGIADLFGLADRHHRDLRIENRLRRLAGKIVDDFRILPPCVEDLQNVFIFTEQVPQRCQIEPVGKRVDGGRFFLIADLHQAEFRPIGILAHEFGVDADEFVFCQALAQFGQRFCRRNQFVYFHRTRFWFGRSAAHGPDRPKTTGRAQP